MICSTASLPGRRQDQARGLAESERRLIELHKRREIHLRYLEHEQQASSHRLALPLAHVRALAEQHREQLARARSLQQQAQETDRAYQEQLARRDQAQVDLEQEGEVLDGLDRRYHRLGEEADGLAEELAEARVRHGELERLRSRAEALPVQDLSRLEQLLEEARAGVASTTHLLGELGKQREGLEQELEQVRQGVLPVPGEVRAFRRVLRQQKVPHQLLMDLLDPAACAGDDRAALESFLGDLRLAVAVPDLDSFVRVVDLAREHRFPFHVLAPDVRARRPARGEHPFLDAVRVIGFAVEGQLRDREDGRFEVDLKVGVGEKLPVPYSSSSLSGGERAALSILMGMSTMETGDRLGPGFFIVDEPFSASDTHKIQELGAFLDRTGAQYLVSMPTSMDISRCGGWLRSVLTCTRVAGGVDERGELRLALPVRCSYVEHDEQPEPA